MLQKLQKREKLDCSPGSLWASRYHGPWLVDIVSGGICLIGVAVFCQFWAPRSIWDHEGRETNLKAGPDGSAFRPGTFMAWMPWIILTVVVFIWGMPAFVRYCDSLLVIKIPVPYLDGLVQRVAPHCPGRSPARSGDL